MIKARNLSALSVREQYADYADGPEMLEADPWFFGEDIASGCFDVAKVDAMARAVEGFLEYAEDDVRIAFANRVKSLIEKYER